MGERSCPIRHQGFETVSISRHRLACVLITKLGEASQMLFDFGCKGLLQNPLRSRKLLEDPLNLDGVVPSSRPMAKFKSDTRSSDDECGSCHSEGMRFSFIHIPRSQVSRSECRGALHFLRAREAPSCELHITIGVKNRVQLAMRLEGADQTHPTNRGAQTRDRRRGRQITSFGEWMKEYLWG